MITDAIICPGCGHFDYDPQFKLQKGRSAIVVQQPFTGQFVASQLFVLVPRWHCPGCEQDYLLSICPVCGADVTSPVEGASGAVATQAHRCH